MRYAKNKTATSAPGGTPTRLASRGSQRCRFRRVSYGAARHYVVATLTCLVCCTGRFGYHFPHPKQEEDILTETNVKDGLHLPTSVAVRLFIFFVFWDKLRIYCLLGRNMGGVGNVSATLGYRYSCGARGPYEPGICSPCRGRRHTVRLLHCSLRETYAYKNPAEHLLSAYPNASPPTMLRDKHGSPTSLTRRSHYTNLGRAFHTARRAKTCSTCSTPTPSRSRAQFGSSVSLGPMRSLASAISPHTIRRNTALSGRML